MRKNNKQINFRVSEKDYNYIKRQSEKANITLTDYLKYSALNKNIYVIDGLDDATRELAKIGNNLNQIAQKAHVLNVVDVQRYDKEVRKFNEAVRKITEAVILPEKNESWQ